MNQSKILITSLLPKDIIEKIETVHNGSPSLLGNLNNALEMFDENDDGVIDFMEFIALGK